MKAINENELIEDLSTLIRLPIPDLRLAIWHKAEELKQQFKKDIDEFQKVKEIIEPGNPGKENEKPVKQIRFELRKKKTGWTSRPDIPQEIVNHIISHDINPGIMGMYKFKLSDGIMINLSYERQTESFFTGSIKEKATEKATKKTPSKQARKADNKTENLKTFLNYLLNNKILYDWMINEFFEHWKPLIDDGFINIELNGR